MSRAHITDVKGIGQSTADILVEHGVRTVEDLAGIDFDVLIAIPGFSGLRAARVIEEAQALVAAAALDTEPDVIRKERAMPTEAGDTESESKRSVAPKTTKTPKKDKAKKASKSKDKKKEKAKNGKKKSKKSKTKKNKKK